MSGPRPPRLARRLLAWLLPADLRASVPGDLEEVFRRNRVRNGALRARLAYWKDALALLGRLALARVRNRSVGRRTRRPRDGGSPSLLDVRLGLRMLGKYPGQTLVGGLGMAVAIAVGVGFFSVAYHFMYPTLPLPDGDRLVGLENWDVQANNEDRHALHDFVAWRQQMRSVVQISAFRDTIRNLIDDEGGVTQVPVAEMTASGFEVARVPPLLGRYLVRADEQPDAPPVVVIGYDVWRVRFAADPDVLGRRLRLGDGEYTVVGVMPEGYAFPLNHTFWVPFRWDPEDWERGRGPEIFIFGRLADGVTRAQAEAELAAIGQRSAAAWPATHEYLRPHVWPYTYPLVDIQDVSVWDLGVTQLIATLLLVVVAMNVAVISYARVATRRGEIAVRSALGASRARIVVQLFVEALVLSSLAALVGLLIAHWGLTQANIIMEEEIGPPPFWGSFALGSAAIPVVIGLTTLAAVIVGVVPGLQATGRRLKSTLAQLSGGAGLRLGRTWAALIVAQVAIAVCGLSVGISLTWDQVAVMSFEANYARRELIAARTSMDVEPPPGADPQAYLQQLRARYREVRDEWRQRLERDPTIAAVTYSADPPGSEPSVRIEIEGMPDPTDSTGGYRVRSGQVGPDLFDALGVSILAGRPLRADDVGGETTPVLVSRAFVERFLDGAPALGRRIRMLPAVVGEDDGPPPEPGPWHEVVGVVEDLYTNRMDAERVAPVIYQALTWGDTDTYLLVRAPGDPGYTIARVRRVAAALDPSMRVGMRSVETLDRQRRAALRLIAGTIGFVMLSVLLLCAAGIYALMSFAVTRRRREIGIRAALGALPHRILASVFSRAFVQLAVGVAIGVVAALALDGFVDGAFSEGAGRFMIPAVSALVLLVGLLATLGPARRGLRVDPTEALRAE